MSERDTRPVITVNHLMYVSSFVRGSENTNSYFVMPDRAQAENNKMLTRSSHLLLFVHMLYVKCLASFLQSAECPVDCYKSWYRSAFIYLFLPLLPQPVRGEKVIFRVGTCKLKNNCSAHDSMPCQEDFISCL